MCGIVCYFGGEGNGLTRILTAMSAIIYRAPDSTGTGLFGDFYEPIRLRKSLGSVSRLVETLNRNAAYPSQAGKLLEIWLPRTQEDSLEPVQRRILKFEGHSPKIYEPYVRRQKPFPTFDELIQTEPAPLSLIPGVPGNPDMPGIYPLRNRQDLKKLIRILTVKHDLSTVAIRALIRSGLALHMRKSEPDSGSPDPADTLAAFERIFDATASDESFYQKLPLKADGVPEPDCQELVWNFLQEIRFQTPPDFDRDGVRGLFRLMDAALVCRLRLRPDRHAALQQTLEALWPEAADIPNTDWFNIYQAEKGANVFGWGGAAVLAYLQMTDVLPAVQAEPERGEGADSGLVFGHTDPLSLRFLSQPLIAHGRWALQSAVTEQNAHPFFDARRQRCIVLNGQFSTAVETDTRDFLETVVDIPFRTDNSAEYFSLLWGYYFDNLMAEKKRYDEIRLQVDTGREDLYIGSHSIDYKVYGKLKDKTADELDETAFIEAARRMIADGGQIAVAGISLRSPRRIYLACHNRPAFVVLRHDNSDMMIVSDINAALGLFSQAEIHDRVIELNLMHSNFQRELAEHRASGVSEAENRKARRRQAIEINRVLEPFRVTVFPLEGGEIFARLETVFSRGELNRQARITDFEGNPQPDIEAFSTVLNPLQIRKELFGSFYETHLFEVPERFSGILRYYLDERNEMPRFEIRERELRRRFGRMYSGIQRIVLAGMGGSFNIGRTAETLLRDLLPQMDIRVLQPVEVEDIRLTVFPEKDLTVLLSWSGTTADMVEFAKELASIDAVMIGLSEKNFSDMALVTAKSGGVISTLSGEEVTISALKSNLCMLFSLQLLGIWLADRMNCREMIREHLDMMHRVPEDLNILFSDTGLRDRMREITDLFAGSHACMIIGDEQGSRIGREAAMKMEEISWSAIGIHLDYSDVLPNRNSADGKDDLFPDDAGHFIIVNATGAERADEALEVMRAFHEAGIRFAAVADVDTPHRKIIGTYASGLCLFLPHCPFPTGQVYIDLAFYYLFAYEFGRAVGRQADEFPRNRVKSVAAGRSREKRNSTMRGELMELERMNRALSDAGSAPILKTDAQSLWEQRAGSRRERKTWHRIRKLGRLFRSPDPFGKQVQCHGKLVDTFSRLIFDELTESGEVVFLPQDREAEAAVRDIVVQWPRILKCPMRTGFIGEGFRRNFHEDTLLVCVSTRPGRSEAWKRISDFQQRPPLWIGPKAGSARKEQPKESEGFIIGDSPAASEELYAALSLILLETWKRRRLEPAEILESHFRCTEQILNTVLNDERLYDAAAAAVTENRKYHTCFFVGSPSGAGLSWSRRFSGISGMDMAWHIFGESAHGPLVTVDARAEKKFVSVPPPASGKTSGGAAHSAPPVCERPFEADGRWYLPRLREDYDTLTDNLIFVDGTRQRFSDRLLDELSAYGCRYARMVLITQEAFLRDSCRKGIFKHPLSHLIVLPSVGSDGDPIPVSGFILPFVMNAVGTALAEFAERGDPE